MSFGGSISWYNHLFGQKGTALSCMRSSLGAFSQESDSDSQKAIRGVASGTWAVVLCSLFKRSSLWTRRIGMIWIMGHLPISPTLTRADVGTVNSRRSNLQLN